MYALVDAPFCSPPAPSRTTILQEYMVLFVSPVLAVNVTAVPFVPDFVSVTVELPFQYRS